MKPLLPVSLRLLLLPALLLAASVVRLPAQTNLLVAQDGSGQFKSVHAAIMSVPAGTAANPVVIRIKPGIYKESLYVQREKRFFRLIGEDAEKTVLTYGFHANLNGPDDQPLGTFRTPSTTIDADDFVAERVTFENSAGPVGQALAIRLDGDRAVFRDCRFLGWQDTIFANRGRHYFTNCFIAGHVDFIFGGATTFFDRCRIHCLRTGYITAASTPHDERFGFVFAHCTIAGEPGVKTFLGRPWRDHAATVWLHTEMSEVVRPEGWDNWKLPHREATSRYAEFDSTGPGAQPDKRVKWVKPLAGAEASGIGAAVVLRGTDGWNPHARR